MREIWMLLNSMSPYLLLGFGFAGLLHVFVPAFFYRRYLSGNDFRSVLGAALIGVPLPLCSCGVIPTAMSLRREGASKGAVTSFLIATPQTGVDSILATVSLMGIPFAVLRPVAALVTALLGGQLVNVATRNDTDDICAAKQCDIKTESLSFWQKCLRALKYGYVDMIQDIGRWLVLGLIIAGLITVFVPDDFFLRYADMPVIGMLVMLLISVPMYVCATGSIPIAAALMLKGLSPGAALVLLMAGPASNMASILVIRKVMGMKTLMLYLLSITIGAMAFGLCVDYLLPQAWFTEHLVVAKACCAGGPAPLNVVCTIVLCVLLAYALVLRFLPNKQNNIMEQRTFNVEGMMCNHCRANVEKALQNLQGVESVEVDLAAKTAIVKGTATDEEIINAIKAIGYEAAKK